MCSTSNTTIVPFLAQTRGEERFEHWGAVLSLSEYHTIIQHSPCNLNIRNHMEHVQRCILLVQPLVNLQSPHEFFAPRVLQKLCVCCAISKRLPQNDLMGIM